MDEKKVTEASATFNKSAQEIADETGTHIQIVVQFVETGVTGVRTYHPATCPERQAELAKTEEAKPVDTPEWVKNMFKQEGGDKPQ